MCESKTMYAADCHGACENVPASLQWQAFVVKFFCHPLMSIGRPRSSSLVVAPGTIEID